MGTEKIKESKEKYDEEDLKEMAKRYNQDDEDWRNIRPGDIESIFDDEEEWKFEDENGEPAENPFESNDDGEMTLGEIANTNEEDIDFNYEIDSDEPMELGNIEESVEQVPEQQDKELEEAIEAALDPSKNPRYMAADRFDDLMKKQKEFEESNKELNVEFDQMIDHYSDPNFDPIMNSSEAFEVDASEDEPTEEQQELDKKSELEQRRKEMDAILAEAKASGHEIHKIYLDEFLRIYATQNGMDRIPTLDEFAPEDQERIKQFTKVREELPADVLTERQEALNYQFEETMNRFRSEPLSSKILCEYEDKPVIMDFSKTLTMLSKKETEEEYFARVNSQDDEASKIFPFKVEERIKEHLISGPNVLSVIFKRSPIENRTRMMIVSDFRHIYLETDKIQYEIVKLIEESYIYNNRNKILFQYKSNGDIHVIDNRGKDIAIYDRPLMDPQNCIQTHKEDWKDIIQKRYNKKDFIEFVYEKDSENILGVFVEDTNGMYISFPKQRKPIEYDKIETPLIINPKNCQKTLLKLIKDSINPEMKEKYGYTFYVDFKNRICVIRRPYQETETDKEAFYKFYISESDRLHYEKQYMGYVMSDYYPNYHCHFLPTDKKDRVGHQLIFHNKDNSKKIYNTIDLSYINGEKSPINYELLIEIIASNNGYPDDIEKQAFWDFEYDISTNKIKVYKAYVSEKQRKNDFIKDFFLYEKDRIAEIRKQEQAKKEKLPEGFEEADKEFIDEFHNEFNPKEFESQEEYMEYQKNKYSKFMEHKLTRELNEVTQRYTPEDMLSYMKNFENKKDMKSIIKDEYINNYTRFKPHNTVLHPKEFTGLIWVLSIGRFCDHVEYLKANRVIESEVDVEHDYSSDTIEDPAIADLKAHKAKMKAKYSDMVIDRGVFLIADDLADSTSSVFDEKRELVKEFCDSPFYNILKEVMEDDQYFDMSKIRYKLIINERTSYIPIIDFNTGVRVLCIDTDDVDQYRLNPTLISNKVRFEFPGFMRHEIRVRQLYSDNCKARPIANIFALKKLVAFRYMRDKYKVILNRNYVIGYTTEVEFIKKFDGGDPDSKRAENSTYVTQKPRNMSIGVIVVDKRSTKDRQMIRRHQIMRDNGFDDKNLSVDDYDVHMVLSAGIIRNDLRLRDPSLPPSERYVEYIISQYAECNPCVILDGLQVITACIIKEHHLNYDNVRYSISFELDRDALVSPAIIAMIDEQDGIAPSLTKQTRSLDVESQFMLPPSRAEAPGVFDFELGRLDKRLVQAYSIRTPGRYPKALWQRYDIDTQQGLHEFLRSRGFEEFLIPKPITFDLLPYSLMSIESSDMIRNIQKVSLMVLRDRNSTETEDLLSRQRQLEYLQSIENTPQGNFQKILFQVADFLLDNLHQNK